MRARRGLALALCFLLAHPAMAFDEAVHHGLIYTLARVNNFSPRDAEMIAVASQSLDNNDTTTALSDTLLKQSVPPAAFNALIRAARTGANEQAAVRAVIEEGANLPHVIQGQIWHALAAPEVRQVVEQAHLRRLQAVRSDTRLSAENRRNLELAYFGQYLHFVADLAVHPKGNPVLGHLEEMDRPDRAASSARKLEATAAALNQKMIAFQRSENGPLRLKPTDPNSLEGHPARLHPEEDKNRVTKRITNAILSSSWMPSQSEIRQEAARQRALDSAHVFDTVRYERTARRLEQVMREEGSDFRPFDASRKMVFDENGNPLPQGAFARAFTGARSIEVLPIRDMLAQDPTLAKERRTAAAAALRDTDAQIAFAKVASQWPAGYIDEIKARARNRTETALGGIALSPRVKLTGGARDMGVPERFDLENGRIALVTSRGSFELEEVDPRTFALFFHSISDGVSPYVTIGTTRSDVPGYDRVLYSPRFRGTREGMLLYRADMQFKAIMGRYAFGNDLDLHPAAPESASDIASGYPGMSGTTRFWITAGDVTIAASSSQSLAPLQADMRINTESWFRDEVVRDKALDAYAAKLTGSWPELKKRVWEFNEIEKLAIASAWAFYAKDNRIPVAPAILILPPASDYTPDYVRRLVVQEPNGELTTGGVSLAPESKLSSLGQRALLGTMAWQDELGFTPPVARSLFAGHGLGMIGGLLFWGTIFLWLILRPLTASLAGQKATLGRCLKLFVKIGIWYFVAAWAIWLLMATGILGWFDREFLTFSLIFLVAPLLTYAVISRDKDIGAVVAKALKGRPVRKLVLGIWAILGAFNTQVIAIGLALIIVGVRGFESSPVTNYMLTFAMVPHELNHLATETVVGAPYSGEPKVLGWQWYSHIRGYRSAVESRNRGLSRTVHSNEKISPMGGDPFRIETVRWPDGLRVSPAIQYFTIDGSPPL